MKTGHTKRAESCWRVHSTACFAAGLIATLYCAAASRAADDEPADLILHHGRIVTVDAGFSIAQALAVRDGRITKVGSDNVVLRLRGPKTTVVDLSGKMVLPGLIDSHTHPADASLTEFDHPIHEMRTIADVLAHVRERAKTTPAGKWIEIHQVFITRLAEQRYPTRAELDAAAPDNPVAFVTGPDAALNSLALTRCGIDKNFEVTGSGEIVRDPHSREPTGVMHGCNRYLKIESFTRQPTEAERLQRLCELFRDYNSVGLTTVCDRAASIESEGRYKALADADRLTVRMAVSRLIETDGKLESIQENIRKVAADPLVHGDARLSTAAYGSFRRIGLCRSWKRRSRATCNSRPTRSATAPCNRCSRRMKTLIAAIRSATRARRSATAIS